LHQNYRLLLTLKEKAIPLPHKCESILAEIIMSKKKKSRVGLGINVIQTGCRIIKRKNRGMVAGCYDSSGHFIFRSAKTFRS
jgi:hypothetical protein